MERLLCRFSEAGDGQLCAERWEGCSSWGMAPQRPEDVGSELST